MLALLLPANCLQFFYRDAPCSDAAQEYVPLSACLAHAPLASTQQPTAVGLSVPVGQPLDDSSVVLVLVSGTHGFLCPCSGWPNEHNPASDMAKE